MGSYLRARVYIVGHGSKVTGRRSKDRASFSAFFFRGETTERGAEGKWLDTRVFVKEAFLFQVTRRAGK